MSSQSNTIYLNQWYRSQNVDEHPQTAAYMPDTENQRFSYLKKLLNDQELVISQRAITIVNLQSRLDNHQKILDTINVNIDDKISRETNKDIVTALIELRDLIDEL